LPQLDSEDWLSDDHWRLIHGTLVDITTGPRLFRGHEARRKIALFGSARTPQDAEAYLQATTLTPLAARNRFDVITGAAPGVMEAANKGAGKDRSFGLNVELTEEQEVNASISSHAGRLLNCRYFYTRKPSFLARAMPSLFFQVASAHG